MNLGKLGIWTAQLDFAPTAVARETVRDLEELGYGAIWVGENIGREPIAQSVLLLSATKRITVATGVANIWARDPLAMAAAHRTIAEAYPDRFVLGLGVSHRHLVEKIRGQTYHQPLQRMRDYLTDMDRLAERYRAAPPTATPRLLAALGPRMLHLAAEHADGAHTYFVPPEHTATAREILGPDKTLAVEQAVVLETNPDKARAIARTHTRRYMPLPNYTRNLQRLGFAPDDFDNQGSDRLADAIVTWGNLDAIAQRLNDHWSAGADHICIQVIPTTDRDLPTQAWKELAALLPSS
jgi:probable F420-dependent oxidoreductase